MWKSDLTNDKQLANYATKAKHDDYGRMFVMRCKANSILANTNEVSDTWIVKSSASNHMIICHNE